MRVGRPVTTGRGRSLGRQVLIRLSSEEYERIERAAGGARVAGWIRDAAVKAAR
jgi:hypothetical protein